MKVVLATIDDLPFIMEIIKHAQHYLATLKIDQWQNGYPNEAVITHDIINKESYLVINENDEIMATAVFSTRAEATYKSIDGNWLTDNNANYGVIHRMAVHNNFRGDGAVKFIFTKFEKFLKDNTIYSMRIDTHRDNIGMQKLLLKMNYKYCGVITLIDGNERLAFEKKIH